MYHTSLGVNHSGNISHLMIVKELVSNIHVTLLIGYDDKYYYYIDPLWSHLFKFVIFPAIVPNRFQVIKIAKSN